MPPSSAASSEALLDALRACLTPSAARRPPVEAVLQQLRASAPQLDASLPGGRRASGLDRARGEHTAGLLTLRDIRASGLFPKASSAGGVKAYLLLTCGGQRRVTPVAPKGHEVRASKPAPFGNCVRHVLVRDAPPPSAGLVLTPVRGAVAARQASWVCELAVPTHGLQTLELTLWAYHHRTTHDFLGAVVLVLPSVLPDPSQPTQLPPTPLTLQKRSHKSHVAGELSFHMSWEPFAQPTPPSPSPPPPPWPPGDMPTIAILYHVRRAQSRPLDP